MTRRLVLAVDQSTQGTKALLFDEGGSVVAKATKPHRQIVDARGWVEHDPDEIVANVLEVCREACERADALGGEVVALGVSDQRETVVAWDRETGRPLHNAIVWQCARAKDVCEGLADAADLVLERSGMPLSPYFSAAKCAWLLRNVDGVAQAAAAGTLALGTIDSWLAYSLCEGRPFVTEPSNASRMQLLDIGRGEWDEGLCRTFGVPRGALARVMPSDATFGLTDLGGLLPRPIPLCGMLGDSQAALLAQGCVSPGSLKATYGTGSSVMMNVGTEPLRSTHGLVTSIAWDLGGVRSYVLEGNLNYTGAVVSWLKDDARLIEGAGESEALAREANPADRSYFVPAFTGLGAPWWDSEATGLLTGVTRTTGRAEIVRACVDCIAYQVADVVEVMRQDTGLAVDELRVDGGATRNRYLMQMQADVAQAKVSVSGLEELSAAGVALVAGRVAGLEGLEAGLSQVSRTTFEPTMASERRESLVGGWHDAVRQAMAHA